MNRKGPLILASHLGFDGRDSGGHGCRIVSASLRHIGTATAALAAQSLGTDLDQIDSADTALQIVRHGDDQRHLALVAGSQGDHAAAYLLFEGIGHRL